MQLIKQIFQILLNLFLVLIKAIANLFIWWVNKIKNSSNPKQGLAWLIGGLIVMCCSTSFLISLTPGSRERAAQIRITRTALAVAEATNESIELTSEAITEATNNAITPIYTPQLTATPMPTQTPELLKVKFDIDNQSLLKSFHLRVDNSKLTIAFNLIGDNADFADCLARGEGVIFRDNITLTFSLIISQPDGTIIYENSAITLDDENGGGGFSCRLNIENNTGFSNENEFIGMIFSLKMFGNGAELDSIELIADGTKLVQPDTVLQATAEPTTTSNATVTVGQANVRLGPGTNYPIVGTIAKGDNISATGFSSDKNWVQIQLADGSIGWVGSELVKLEGTANLPTISDIPAVPTSTVNNSPSDNSNSSNGSSSSDNNVNDSSDGSENAFQCIGGCATPPDPSCSIKGNVNSSGEKIYHVQGGSFYNRTDIKPEEGDRWFCTESEAQSAGFRRSER